jgi:hypothetical protein
MPVEVRIDGIDLPHSANLDAYPLPSGSHVVILRGRGRIETHTVEVPRGEVVTLTSRLR